MKNYIDSAPCSCGKTHPQIDIEIIIENGAVKKLPELIKGFGAQRPFVVADVNTYNAAGKAVVSVLESAEIPYSLYVFKERHLEPDERAVGSAVMNFDSRCDIVLGVGSGVINDICKILSATADKKYIIVATAPSMDG